MQKLSALLFTFLTITSSCKLQAMLDLPVLPKVVEKIINQYAYNPWDFADMPGMLTCRILQEDKPILALKLESDDTISSYAVERAKRINTTWNFKTGALVTVNNKNPIDYNTEIQLTDDMKAIGYSSGSIQIKQNGKMIYGFVHGEDIEYLLKIGENSIASCSRTDTLNRVKIFKFDIKTSTRMVLAGHTAPVRCLLRLTEQSIASGSEDGSIKIWNLDLGICADTLTEKNGILSLALLPGNRIAAGLDNGKIHIWDLETRKCTASWRAHQDHVRALIALPGNKLASGSQDGTIKIWTLGEEKLKALYEQAVILPPKN
jgi:WD40 repeat protein